MEKFGGVCGQVHPMSAMFLLALRKSEGASVKKFQPILKKMKQSVKDLSQKGLIQINHQRLTLTPRGQFFAETIFSEFSSTEP